LNIEAIARRGLYRSAIVFKAINKCIQKYVEHKRARMKELNCRSIQEKENTRNISREKTIVGEAEYHNRVRIRQPGPELGLLLSMGECEAHGGEKPPA
jgi:hypothetical protein